MLINIKTKERIDEYAFRQANQSVSFPTELTDAVLAEFGFAVLNYPAVPVAPQGKKIVDGGVEQIDGKWFAKYVEADLTQEEVGAYADGIRADRNQRLSGTDWTQGKDIPDAVSTAWQMYRQALRDVPNQSGFPFAVEWPVAPS